MVNELVEVILTLSSKLKTGSYLFFHWRNFHLNTRFRSKLMCVFLVKFQFSEFPLFFTDLLFRPIPTTSFHLLISSIRKRAVERIVGLFVGSSTCRWYEEVYSAHTFALYFLHYHLKPDMRTLGRPNSVPRSHGSPWPDRAAQLSMGFVGSGGGITLQPSLATLSSAPLVRDPPCTP